MTDADRLVAAYIMEMYRASFPHSDSFAARHRVSVADASHLATCDTTRVENQDHYDGIGCDTGCEKVTLEADIVCDHGRKIEYEYGEWGDFAGLVMGLERLEKRDG